MYALGSGLVRHTLYDPGDFKCNDRSEYTLKNITIVICITKQLLLLVIYDWKNNRSYSRFNRYAR